VIPLLWPNNGVIELTFASWAHKTDGA